MQLKNTFLSLTAIVLALGLSACSKDVKTNTSNTSESNVTEVKIGLVGEHNAEWEAVSKRLEGSDVKLTIVKFADYSLPNRVLNDGEIDLNAFQHKAYLEEDSKAHNYDFEILSDTFIVPLAAYSDKIKSLDELKEGDTIAIPNDLTNGGRALKLLEKANVIKLDPSKGYTPEVKDIIENPKHIKIYEVDAANTVSLIPDVAASIVNSNYAVDNKLDPAKDAIFSDLSGGGVESDNPYVNVVICRKADKDNPILKKVIAEYQKAQTAALVIEQYKGAAIPVFKYQE